MSAIAAASKAGGGGGGGGCCCCADLGLPLISQGAEARVYALDDFGFCGSDDSFTMPAVVKERFAKAYRHPKLEEKLCNRRLVHEVRSLARAAKAGVRVPCVYYVDKERKWIVMEKLKGSTAKSFIQSREKSSAALHAPNNPAAAQLLSVCDGIGDAIARMHGAKIIHGDLTTSNIFVDDSGETIVVSLIDFGLGQAQANAEDMAVDLYVLERAFASTHPSSEGMFARVLKAYEESSHHSGAPAAVAKLNAVRARGRKKLAFG